MAEPTQEEIQAMQGFNGVAAIDTGGGTGFSGGTVGRASPTAQQSLWKNRPRFKGIMNNGKLRDAFRMDDPNKALPGYERKMAGAWGDVRNMRGIANSTGDSKWATAQRGVLDQQMGMAQDRLGNQASAQAQAGMSQLGATGGYGGGSRERMMQGANRNAMFAQQGLAGQGMLGQAQIGSQDAQMKQQMLQNLPGMQTDMANSWANVQGQDTRNQMATNQFNTATGINENDKYNQWRQQQFGFQGQMLGAAETSAAMNNNTQSDFNVLNPTTWF